MSDYQARESAFSRITHLALIVPDMDKAIKFLTVLGINFQAKTGREYKQCKGMLGNTGLQVFQTTEEKSIHKEYYDRTGGGIHHLSFDGIENLESAVNLLQENGARIVDSAMDPDGTPRAHYLEVDALPGVMLEIRRPPFNVED